MDGKLIFCNDSILRFSADYGRGSSAIPLESIQKTDKDPFFILKFFKKRVAIEKGTTLGSLIVALEPWKDAFSAYLDRDVGAYIEEAKRINTKIVMTNEFDWIHVQKSVSIHRDYEYEHSEDDDFDFQKMLNRKRTPLKKMNIESTVDAFGIKSNNIETYSLSGTFDTICNVPIGLSKFNLVYSMFNGEENLFNDNAFGVSANHENVRLVVGDSDFQLQELIEAIFVSGLFYYSPQIGKNNTEALQAMFEDMERNKLLEESEIDEDEVSEEMEDDDVNENEPKRMKVSIAPGAFDSVISHMEEESDEWQSLLNVCSQLSDAKPFKEISEEDFSFVPEERIRGFVVNEDGSLTKMEESTVDTSKDNDEKRVLH